MSVHALFTLHSRFIHGQFCYSQMCNGLVLTNKACCHLVLWSGKIKPFLRKNILIYWNIHATNPILRAFGKKKPTDFWGQLCMEDSWVKTLLYLYHEAAILVRCFLSSPLLPFNLFRRKCQGLDANRVKQKLTKTKNSILTQGLLWT